jgi:outer membrane protein insertion porin family
MKWVRWLKVLFWSGLVLFALLLACSFALEFYLKKLILDELNSEARAKCSTCYIEAKGSWLSFMRGEGAFIEPRLKMDGREVLSFREILASVSYRHLWKGELLLSLELLDGWADGVGPDSGLYKFIDQLTTPSHRPPPLIKVRLIDLHIKNSNFREPIKKGEIKGQGLSMSLMRLPDDRLRLTPALKRLSWVRENGTVLLGSVKALLFIKNGVINFEDLTLSRGDGDLQIVGNSKGSDIKGDLSLKFDAKDLDVSKWLSGAIVGNGKLSGTFSKPIVDANVTLDKAVNDTLSINMFGSPLLQFDEAMCKINYVHEKERLSVTDVYATGPGTTLDESSYYILEKESVDSKLILDLARLSFENYHAHGVRFYINSSGVVGDTLPEIVIKIDSLDTGFSEIKGINSKMVFHKTDIELSVKSLTNEIYLNSVLDNETYKPKNGKLVFNDFAFAAEGALGFETDVKLSGEVNLGDPSGLSGQLNSRLLFRDGRKLSLWHLFRGTLKNPIIETSDHAKGIKIYLSLFEKQAKLELQAAYLPNELALPLCLDGTFNLEYEFDYNAPLTGKGLLAIHRIDVGCLPHKIKADLPNLLQINKGVINVSKASLSALNETVALNGSLSLSEGVRNLKVIGRVSMESLATLLPEVDELRGIVSTDISLSGPWSKLNWGGRAELVDVELSQESASIVVTDLHGRIAFHGDYLDLSNFRAIVNDGAVEIHGQLYPLALERSKVDIHFDNVLFEPLDDTYVVGRGDISLGATSELEPRIYGRITIQEAEFRKQFDIFTLIRSMRRSLLEKGGWSPRVVLPEIQLSLDIEAERDLFISTNILETELNAKLFVVGTLDKPIVKGELNTLGGWFGINNRHFDINLGRISFEGIEFRPTLYLVGETVVRTRAGETTTVILEAKGPIENPQIELTADRDILKSELLTMLATNQQGFLQDLTRQSGSTPLSARDVFQLGLPYFLGNLFDDLTRIDYFGIEPTYNALTSSVQPSMVMEKRVLSSSFIRAQALFGGNVTNSSLKLHHRFDSRYEISLGVESASTNLNNALVADISYMLSNGSSNETDLKIKGNDFFNTRTLREVTRISELGLVSLDRMHQIKHRLINHYQDNGFFNVEIKVQCKETSNRCASVNITINEGKRTTISAVDVVGQDLDEFNFKGDFDRMFIGNAASKHLLKRVKREVLKSLRQRDYLRGSVKVVFVADKEPDKRIMQVAIDKGLPMHVTFWGVRVFEEEKLEEVLGLYDYDRVLTANTMRRGVQAIEKLYTDEGYLTTVVNYREVVEGDVLFFHISVTEEPKVHVKDVAIKGNKLITKEKLLTSMGDIADSFKNPEVARASEIAYHENNLRSIYVDLGFTNVKVSSRIKDAEKSNQVIIEYIVDEGSPEYSVPIVFESTLVEKEVLAYPYSTTKARQVVVDHLAKLVASGYRHATFESRYDNEKSVIVYSFDNGVPTRIADVQVEGYKVVSLEEIFRRLNLRSGDLWDEDRIEKARRNLTLTGLFSAVDIVPADGVLNSEEEILLVRLKERDLKSVIVGTGLNSIFGLHLFGAIEDQKFFADGRKITSKVDLYIDASQREVSQGVASILYSHPEVWDTRASLFADVRFQKLTTLTQEFNVERLSATNSFHFPLSSSATTSLGYTLSSEDITDVPEDVRLGRYDIGKVVFGFLGGTTTFDLRDQPLRPRSGTTFSFDYKLADSILLSDPSFYSLNSRITGLVPVSDRLTLALSTRWGWSDVIRKEGVVPISHRFYLGGRLSVRGFRENSLGPSGVEGNVIGGEVVQNNSVELQYLLGADLETHAFWDTGNMALRDDLSALWSDYRSSVGLGSRYLSPIGPIGFEVGFPIAERSGEPSLRLHFSIGSQF